MDSRVTVTINDKKVPMNDYIQLLFEKLNLALISTLKGVDEENAKEVKIIINRND